MAIASEELKLYRDINSRISSIEVVDGFKNGLFPDVTEAERTAGVTITRKAFFKVANAQNTQAVNCKAFIKDITPSNGRAVLYDATQRETAPTGRMYGAGRLNADISTGATTIKVDAETGNGANLIFQVGDTLLITSGAGNSEFLTIGAVSWAADLATIDTNAIVNNYLVAGPTTISSVIDAASIEGTTDNYAITSAGGNYDDATYPVVNNNIGGIEQTWTVTFTSTINFNVIGDVVGSIGSGDINGDFLSNNPDFAQPYFTILQGGWGGAWLTNDTFVFQTHPAAQPFFCDLIIDPGTTEYSGDDITFGFIAESA